MFWSKKRKMDKTIKATLAELKQMILSMQISATSSAAELEDFYSKIDLWNKVLTEKQVEFFTVMGQLTLEDKAELLKHIEVCINNYGAKMIKLNDVLIRCLEEDAISPDTKVEIITFGKSNIVKSDKTINVLRDMAKCIVLSK